MAGGLLAAILTATSAGAAPGSDPFGTAQALRDRTAALSDPAGRDCGIPAGALSVAVAVDLALCRNPATRVVWAAARQQAAAVGIAESAWVPGIGASASENWSDGARTGTTAVPRTSATQRTLDAAVNLSWTLYDFGGREARILSARHLLDAAAASASTVSQQVVLSAIQTFYGAVSADAAVVAARSAEAAAAHSLEVAQGRLEAGVATRAEVLQAETAHDQAILTRVAAQGAFASARGLLAITIGTTADRALQLEPDPIPAQIPALSRRVADLMAEAAAQRPDLAAALAQRDAAQADVTTARATGRPSISVGASRNHLETQGFANQNYNSIGVSFSWPVFAGFSTTYRVRQAEAILASREANADQIRLNVSLDVWNAYAGLDTAGEQLKATEALLRSATENEQVALGRYQAGVGTIVDVLTAQSALAAAQQQRIVSEQSWRVARASLALALGRLTSAEPLVNGSVGP